MDPTHKTANALLGELYMNGWGVPVDHEKAEEFCEEDEEFTNRIQDQFLAEEKTDIVGPPLKVTSKSPTGQPLL